MGKAEIISHAGDGQYAIKVLYDTTARDAAITRIDEQIAAMETMIEQLTVLIECQPS